MARLAVAARVGQNFNYTILLNIFQYESCTNFAALWIPKFVHFALLTFSVPHGIIKTIQEGNNKEV